MFVSLYCIKISDYVAQKFIIGKAMKSVGERFDKCNIAQ